MAKVRKTKCSDIECRYCFCKLHPKGCRITSEEEQLLSDAPCRKYIANLVKAVMNDRKEGK